MTTQTGHESESNDEEPVKNENLTYFYGEEARTIVRDILDEPGW